MSFGGDGWWLKACQKAYRLGRTSGVHGDSGRSRKRPCRDIRDRFDDTLMDQDSLGLASREPRWAVNAQLPWDHGGPMNVKRSWRRNGTFGGTQGDFGNLWGTWR